MDLNLKKLIDVLCELRIASISSNINTIESTMKKYNMLFLGEKLNTIYSIELHNSLNKIFNFDIDYIELNSLIPKACDMLKMSYETMIVVEDIGKPNPNTSYKIVLWQ